MGITNAQTLRAECERFYGSENAPIVTGPTRNVMISQGVDWLRHNAGEEGCFWLIDVISSHQRKVQKMIGLTQFWGIKKDPENPNGAIVFCERDANDIVLTQVLEYTDFPLGDEPFKLFVLPQAVRYQGRVVTLPMIILPSEY